MGAPAAASSSSALDARFVALSFLLLSSLKWLLVPSYRSTDFDVHRNWLAITRHLPLGEWYFDDVGGGTVHTLDYPPLFAFFEWSLGNNRAADALLESGWLDARCLELLPDGDNEPSDRCVRYQRGTVVLGDALLFAGAHLAASAFAKSCGGVAPRVTFLLIVTNPGLLMLDHVHFQYNGMMLGLLLASIGCMVRGSESRVDRSGEFVDKGQQRWELLGAAAFGLLLAMKHLYMTLAPLYFFYLLGRHCFVAGKTTGRGDDGGCSVRFSQQRLLVLAAVTLVCFVGPFVPFLVQPDPLGQMQQILKRLFPFGRGVSLQAEVIQKMFPYCEILSNPPSVQLVHDYWAANVWAIYLFLSRVATFAFRKAPIPASVRALVEPLIPFPVPQPSTVALLLLAGIWPGGVHMAWKVGRSSLVKVQCNAGQFFIHAVVSGAMH